MMNMNFTFFANGGPLLLVAFFINATDSSTIGNHGGKRSLVGGPLFGSPGHDILDLTLSNSGYGSPWTSEFSIHPWSLIEPAVNQIQIQAIHGAALKALRDTPPGISNLAHTPEVLHAIQQAKEANHRVFIAQNQVGQVKQAVIIQQKIALTKEAAAREATQRSEAISAHAQAEARTSAQQLVALQQKLATLKDAVAAAQRVAAARETAAAAAIQRNASETAAELRKQDVDKQINQSEREAKFHDMVAAKEIAIAKAVHHAATTKSLHHGPWP